MHKLEKKTRNKTNLLYVPGQPHSGEVPPAQLTDHVIPSIEEVSDLHMVISTCPEKNKVCFTSTNFPQFEACAHARTKMAHISFIKRLAINTVGDTARGLISERAVDQRDAAPLQ